MLKPVTEITITQKGENRNKTLFFDFVNNWEFKSNWENLTNTGKIVFPKNIYVRDESNYRYPLFGENKSINNIFRKGDTIKIEAYYIFWDKNLSQKATGKKTICTGYVSKVKSEMPIELEFEDEMYLLKQMPMTNQVFSKTQSIESILNTELLKVNEIHGTKLKVNNLTSTNLIIQNGTLSAENDTVASFLAKLKKDYFLKSYIKGTELRVGSLIYLENEAKTFDFNFQENIISADLEYKRKDDIILSAFASNYTSEKAGVNKNGVEKINKVRLEVLVTLKNDVFTSKAVKQGEQADANTDGERQTFTFLDAKNEKELIAKATDQLKKYYYNGFKGTFETFGEPHVTFGDNAKLIDSILPERNGTYKIKSVEYSGGVNGYRQKVELDYKLLVNG